MRGPNNAIARWKRFSPDLRSFRDGWRHLRFLLIFSPRWLFAYPGLILMALGGIFSVALFFGPVDIGFRLIDFHSFILAGTMVILGINLLSFSAITRVYAFRIGLYRSSLSFTFWLHFLILKKGLGLVSVLFLGIILIIRGIYLSRVPGFSTLGFDESIRLVFGGNLSVIREGRLFLQVSF